MIAPDRERPGCYGRVELGFERIIGNEKIKKTLSIYLEKGTIPASMIFSGPEGAQQMEVALAFARTLNCTQPEGDPDRVCPSCQAIDRGFFPDVRVVLPDGAFFKKGQIDQLVEEAKLRPVNSKKKVFILNHAHRMNENAANAFLKTLEEPTESTIFILITSNINMLIPTIRSRCQILKFHPLTHAEIKESLVKLGMESERAGLFALYPQIINQTKREWKEMDEKRAGAFSILHCLLTRTSEEDVLLKLQDRSRNREAFVEYFSELVNLISVFLRDIMILLIDRDSRYIANTDYRQQMIDLLETMNMERVFFLIRKMEMILRDIQRNLNARVLILEFIQSYAQGGAGNV